MSTRNEKRRSLTVVLIVVFAFSAFLFKLFDLQILSADEDAETAISTVTVDVNPIRGEILDCNGYPLVTNKQVNKIIFTYSSFPTDYSERNEIILELIRIFIAYKAEWKDELPIDIKNGVLQFTEGMDNSVSYLKSEAFLDLMHYATVQNCFDALVEKYELEAYSLQDARNIASVYYSLVKDGFNETRNYVFASDVSNELASAIMEKAYLFPGVELQIDSEREYPDGTLAPHILGIVGPISQEKYEADKDKGYAFNDYVGISGLEYTYESELRGIKGEKVITVDSSGAKTEKYTKEPIQGNTIVTTIDRKIQKVAQLALDNTIEQIKQKVTSHSYSGAVVVLDVKNNACRAICSNPNYNNGTYVEDYDKLIKNKDNPLWNRATDSTFTPGSTIKPAVTMAGLEEGVIDEDTEFFCDGIYDFYEDYQPGCLDSHGYLDLKGALYNSCNIFFYETSRLLGIEKLNSYFTMFGLGEPTGIEIDESIGNVDSVEYRNERGELWTPGLTIQAGIGHGNNMFTPLQLAVYASTIANKGVRYRAHLVESVKNSDSSSTISETQTQVLSKANFKAENWALLYDGMNMVANSSYVDLEDLSVKSGAKTGTTTVEKTIDGHLVDVNNGFIIAFAPLDDPEIAVAVAIEGAGYSTYAAQVLKPILQYYFQTKNTEEVSVSENALIK